MAQLADQPLADQSPADRPRPAEAQTLRLTPPAPVDRRHVIEDIRRLNPTAGVTFLAQFNTPALLDYLEHLKHAKHKHVRLAGWLDRRTAKLDKARRQLRRAG